MPEDMGPGRVYSTDTPGSETASGAASGGDACSDAAAAGGAAIAEIEEVLTGIKYPAAKKALVQYAQFGLAPTRVVQALQRLPERTYGGVSDLRQELQRSC